MKIQVRKCGFTGRLFESDKLYLKHLVNLRASQTQERARQARIRDFQSWLEAARYGILTIEDLQKWLNENQKRIIEYAQFKETRWNYRNENKNVAFTFSFERMHHHSRISNSHNCPEGGVTNWHSDPKLPKGYPGWRGELVISSNTDYHGFATDIVKIVNVKTGSGGGSHKRSCYEVILFDADWPGLVCYKGLTQ